MSIKSKVLAGAAALSVITGGLGVAAASAHASTPECGNRCVEVSNGGSVLDVYKRTSALGQKVILWGESNVDPATDFTTTYQGTVHDFYKMGLASAALNLHFGWAPAFELQYSPYGVGSHKCVGVDGASGGQVNLRNCGVSANTLWVVVPTKGGYVLISGATKNFSDPVVLSNRDGDAYASSLNIYQGGSFHHPWNVVADNQVWSLSAGIAS
jgi:hypothetical protein